MSLRQLEYAVAIAEEGSVTAAAEKLRVAQPSISQQLRSLEKDLGVTLFTRTPTGVVPTVAGRAFLSEARTAISAARRARSVARSSLGYLQGELVVVVEAGLGMCQLPAALGEVRRQFPAIEISLLEEFDPQVIARRLRSGEADLALGTEPVAECSSSETVAEETYTVVLPDEHPLLRPEQVGLAELADERFVRMTRGSAVDRVLSRALADEGVAGRTAVRVSQLATAARLAAEGLGVAVLPVSSVPAGYTHLARPLSPALSHTVHVSSRGGGGAAEQVLVTYLSGLPWCMKALATPPGDPVPAR